MIIALFTWLSGSSLIFIIFISLKSFRYLSKFNIIKHYLCLNLTVRVSTMYGAGLTRHFLSYIKEDRKLSDHTFINMVPASLPFLPLSPYRYVLLTQIFTNRECLGCFYSS